EEAEVMRRRGGHRELAALRSIPGMLQCDRVTAIREIDVDGTGRARARLPGMAGRIDEFERDAGEGEITLIAHVTDQHGGGSRRNQARLDIGRYWRAVDGRRWDFVGVFSVVGDAWCGGIVYHVHRRAATRRRPVRYSSRNRLDISGDHSINGG